MMKRAVLNVVKDFPDIHGKVGLIFNATTITFTDREGGVPKGVQEEGMANGGRQEVKEGVADRAAGRGMANEGDQGLGEVLLLSDQIMDTLVQDLGEFCETLLCTMYIIRSSRTIMLCGSFNH